MVIKIILLFTVLLYSVIASQSISYIISLADVQRHMSVTEYISFRKRTDENFRSKFGAIVYAALIANAALVVACSFAASFFLLIGSIVSMLLLSADTFITVKYNLPINNTVNEWSAENYPADWSWYRQQWLAVFFKRQCLNLTGFVSLVAGAVFY
jgi:hypothetical protein